MNSYSVSYTYTIRQCGPGIMSGPMINSIEGSATMRMLSGLEEDSDYTIILTAFVGGVSVGSDEITVLTSTAGASILIINLIIDVLWL